MNKRDCEQTAVTQKGEHHMKHIFKTTALWLACFMSSPAFSAPSDSDSSGPLPPSYPAEVLKGVMTDDSGLTIQVESNGCTDKNSFDVLIFESHPAQVEFIRKRHDVCRAYMPYGVKIKFTYEELGLNSPQSFFLVNSVDSGLLPFR